MASQLGAYALTTYTCLDHPPLRRTSGELAARAKKKAQREAQAAAAAAAPPGEAERDAGADDVHLEEPHVTGRPALCPVQGANASLEAIIRTSEMRALGARSADILQAIHQAAPLGAVRIFTWWSICQPLLQVGALSIVATMECAQLWAIYLVPEFPEH
ncbi:unnamed protein product, partial [Symbiodinium microadriaticum]